mmetsp:Transcript_46163/g.93183  ORF Transcript_46163/g.93183 Transcript_46163/m.93183 type:complete len:105 (-) Transcript_46163:47-361(-)
MWLFRLTTSQWKFLFESTRISEVPANAETDFSRRNYYFLSCCSPGGQLAPPELQRHGDLSGGYQVQTTTRKDLGVFTRESGRNPGQGGLKKGSKEKEEEKKEGF